MNRLIYTIRESLRILYKEFKTFVWTASITSILTALLPLVLIHASARIIDAVTKNLGQEEVIKWMVISIIISFVVRIINEKLNVAFEVENRTTISKLFKKFQHRFNNMNVKDIENPEVIDEFEKINSRIRYGGKGIFTVMYKIDEILSSLIGMIGSIFLIYPFFTQGINQTSIYSFINTSIFNVIFIIFVITASLITTFMEVKIDGLYRIMNSIGTFGNRVFSFYFYKMTTESKSVDVRIYRQDKLIDKVHAFHDTFLPGGPIDKIFLTKGTKYQMIQSFVLQFEIFMIYIVAIIKASQGTISIGMLSQYIGSITHFSMSLIAFVSVVGLLKNNAVFAEQDINFLNNNDTIYHGTLTTEKRSDKKYEIEFKDVSFRYPLTDTWVLKNINIKFDLGHRLAIVGQNGSGKTTFIKLLLRIYDPDEGQILLNGIDIKKYKYEDYLKIFSVVLQNFNLFAYPIAENVAGSKDYDESRVIQSLKDAGVYNRVMEMKHGIDTYLYKDIDEDGVKISGGEAQKIAIARALYQDAAFIILDEPTAALDPIAEQEIYEHLGTIVKDRTAIFISHRLSSCKFADRIVVFDQGMIIENGAHIDLLNKEGKYKELWESQAKFYV